VPLLTHACIHNSSILPYLYTSGLLTSGLPLLLLTRRYVRLVQSTQHTQALRILVHYTESASTTSLVIIMQSSSRQPRKWTLAEDQRLREEVEAQRRYIFHLRYAIGTSSMPVTNKSFHSGR
jgi:hypothetical protein